ncbi:MAG TPA: hypothetical protein VGP72_14895 [Planctomycetota bacterium]|jgi:tetratricopeptide (TPR) repeat protein
MNITRNFALVACACFASALCFAGQAPEKAAEAAAGDEDLDVITRIDGRTEPPTKIIQDNYERVIGKHKGVERKVASCLVKEVVYGDKDGNYAAALEKRDEGRYALSAMYFLKALTNMTKQKWAAEYCNYGAGCALYEDGKFNGYVGRSGMKYDPPVEYFKKVLEANPKSRFTLDILVKIPVCLAEMGKLDEAEAKLKEAEGRIKKYRDETIPIAQEFGEQCDRASAHVGLAQARMAERKAVGGTGKWDDAKEKYLSARFKCQKYPDLLAEAVDGVLRVLVMMKDYNGAKAEADNIIEKYHKEGEKHLPLLPGAYTVLGKANLAQAVEFEGKNQAIQAKQSYAEARWAFLHVIAQFFDNDDYVAGAHYFAGICYDKLKDIEPDAAGKAVRHWSVIVEHFKKSDFRGEAEKELTRVGAEIPKTPAPEPAGPATAGADTKKEAEPKKPDPKKPPAKK